VKLPNNYFSQRANRANSSESASPAEMDIANKTLYLLEELDDVAIHTSKLKEIVSMDDGRARALYGDNQTIERIGHLMINGNTAPNLGDDQAVWDRAIYIPWDAKYIGEADGPIDPLKGIFRQDINKRDELVKLSSAFLTVCLTEFTSYLKKNPKANSFSIPLCVRNLIASEKEKITPIPGFLEKYLVKQVACTTTTVERLHTAFAGYCNQSYISKITDYSTFLGKLDKTKHELITNAKGEKIVKDHALNEAGSALYVNESRKRGFVSADNMDIPHLFKRQRQE
jgi:phage/plasmid-associated DNA primase